LYTAPLRCSLTGQSLNTEWSDVMTSVATLKSKLPRWTNKKPKKTQGQISIDLAKIVGKNPTFPVRNPTFPEKNSFLPPKISDDFILVINSHFQIFSLFRLKIYYEFLTFS